MHKMQTIVVDVRGVCQSVSLSVCHAAELGFTVRGSFLVKALPNYFGLLLSVVREIQNLSYRRIR